MSLAVLLVVFDAHESRCWGLCRQLTYLARL